MAKRSRSGRADITIAYRAWPFARERYVLKQDALEVSYQSLFETDRYTIDLATLDPRCSRYRRLPAGSLAAALTSAAAGSALLAGTALGLLSALPWALIGLGAAAGMVLCLWRAARLARNCMTFHRLDDGFPAVNLRWRRPDPESFERFVAEMRDRIEHAGDDVQNGTFAAELDGLDRLRREGGLTEHEFRAAKAMLLGIEPWQLED